MQATEVKENYELLKQNNIEGFVKYNTFDKEQYRSYHNKHKTFSKEHLYYNREQDFYVCQMGQRIEKKYEITTKTKNGFIQKQSF
ncbi:hypothetical protein [Chryseobacterium sp. RR2-3-20]|uniref:hypothetical protein n=1 Tax=Chryseobacterium sp. RR2-3-20 TaxID=2787626 RepID=UPI001ADED129|nr:hypothetical protein [Chryseobacterium sp. RR2-3-20]